MDWLILSLLTAFSVASQDTWVKKYFSHLNHYEMSAVPLFYSAPLFASVIGFAEIPPLDKTFWVCFIISLPLNGVALVVYMKAIRLSPLSLTLPYLSFTPAFMIVTGYVFLGEIPGNLGLLGILIICIGAYILNLEKGFHYFSEPVKAIFREKGSVLMLFVALIFSFAAAIGKKTILHSSPEFFTLSFFLIFDLIMVALFLLAGKTEIRSILESPLKGIGAGVLFFSHVMCHGFAISLTKAAYMISVKRFSILIGIIYGRLVFNEENSLVRFVGAFLMICGAALISLSGDI